MARFYDAGFNIPTDEERERQRQALMAATGWNGEPTGASKVPMDGGTSPLPTMDFRTGGDVSPWTPEEAMAQIGPDGKFGMGSPVIDPYQTGLANPNDPTTAFGQQPVSLYERGGGQSGYGGGSTLGGAVGMGGGGISSAYGMGSPMAGQAYGRQSPTGGYSPGRSSATPYGMGRSSPTPYGGSGYSTLGQVGGSSGYGQRRY